MGTVHVIDNAILLESELHSDTVAGRQIKYRGGWRIAPGDWMIANTSKAVVRERASKSEWTGSSGRLAIVGFESAKLRALSKRVAVGTLQYNKLLGLAESGVSAINLTQTATQVAQGKSTFTKTVSGVDANGNPVSTSTEQTVQNVNFSTNNFYRAFTDNPTVTASAALLPQMQGAGLVKDLREAMSLGTGQAVALQSSLGTSKSNSTTQADCQKRRGLRPNNTCRFKRREIGCRTQNGVYLLEKAGFEKTSGD